MTELRVYVIQSTHGLDDRWFITDVPGSRCGDLQDRRVTVQVVDRDASVAWELLARFGRCSALRAVTEKFRGRKIIAITARKKPKIRKVVVTVGSARGLTLVAGQSKVVQISLNRRGKRLLASRHTLKVTLHVTQVLGGGRSKTVSQTVKFKAPKHKKHHH